MLTDELEGIRTELATLRKTTEAAIPECDDDELQSEQDAVDRSLHDIGTLVKRGSGPSSGDNGECHVHLEIDIGGTREEVAIILAEIQRIKDGVNSAKHK